ncbi:hypothetical protein E0L36_26555 [Streptomyces sp. AJS327]|uniref:hypothetical protein n=1 Tax=Streptomyces sp. AJS327 TaxID=2545265 RepID=UPI0015DE83E5|nr:hypothetical protein [Streptomyces sp. AJS327]MBA0054282.1 hypothetical protein [Streptomyces sp. AJS327]
MDGYTVAWLSWLGLFVVVEGKALLNKRDGDTLSEHVWRWFATTKTKTRETEQPSGWVRLRRFGLLAFMGWLTAHFLTGGRF